MSLLTFKPDSPELQALHHWWEGLEKHPGVRAELRRCGDLQEAALAVGTQDLCRRVKGEFRDLVQIGAVAALASHVTQPHPRYWPLAKAFAGEQNGPALSELRFRRLIQCQDREDLFPLLRRALELFKGQADLDDLARSVWYWNDVTRREWTFSYYQQASLTESQK